MADGLTIEEVQISAPRLVAGPSLDGGERYVYVVGIHVRNHSKKDTYHVISDVRSLEYDTATQTLYLGLSEDQPAPEERRMHIHKLAPHQMAIPPDQETMIEVSVPQVIKRINLGASAGLGVKIEEIDISGVQHVACRINFDIAPFYPQPTEPSDRMRERLRVRGTTVERTVMPRRGPR